MYPSPDASNGGIIPFSAPIDKDVLLLSQWSRLDR